MQKILKTYLKRLTNLTSRNKSLLLLSLPARQFVDLHAFDFLNSKSSFDIIEQLIAQKNTIPLIPVHDSRYDKINEVSKQLKQIQRTAKFIEEESGALDLFIGYPFVRGKLSDNTSVRCPLLFFPVSLELENNRWKLTKREDEEVVINKNFLLAYSYFNHVPIADEWLDADFEEFSKESLVFRTELYEWLKKSPVEINFNQDLLRENTLIPFDNFNKSRFEENTRIGEIKLFPEAVLGIFPQAGSYLTPDYQQIIEENKFENFDDFFAQRMNIENHSIAREENTYTPFSIDASQERALKMVKEGKSLVVQGPPGTGKSQLIANLIADYTARGKKVLLVCQKRAALDVVYQRLSQMGMQDFLALVHDFRHDRKPLYAQLANQIEKVDTYKSQNQNLDAIYLERDFAQQSRRIDKLSAGLDEFKTALFDEKECGASVKELYLTSFPHLPVISLKKEYKYFNFSINTSEFLRKLKYYENYAQKSEVDEYVWKKRVSFDHFTSSDLSEITETISQVPKYQQSLQEKIFAFIGKNISFKQAEDFWEEKKKWIELLETIRNETQWQIFREAIQKKKEKEIDGNWFKEKEKQVSKCFSGNGIEKSTSKQSLNSTYTLLKEAQNVENSFLLWAFYKLFSKNKPTVVRVLDQNSLNLDRDGLRILEEKLLNRQKLEVLLEEMGKVNEVVNPYDLEYLQRWFENQKQAIKAKKLSHKLDFFKSGMPLLQETHINFQQKTHILFALLQEASAIRKSWNKYLTDGQIDDLLDGKLNPEGLINPVREDFDDLVETDRIKNEMSSVEKQVCERLWEKRQKSENQLNISLADLFDNSLRLAWIDHIEEKYPVLQSVSTQKLNEMETELQEAVSQKAKLSQHILLMRLRENTYREVEFNRLRNQVTYRDLKHQTTKKRNIWTVRRLMNELSDEVSRLIPCWMASPETVSAVFPLASLEKKEPFFDLVIFDEASQCFAENGLPSMFRAKQVVITGDSKQLTPNDLYSVRFEEENDDNPELEIESLLDLSARYFTQVQLQGHYRSKSLDLIDFSNQHFYKNTLQLLPDRHSTNQYEPAISFVKVEGVWENSANETEADEVVKIVSELLQKVPKKEIGIVTFNFKQQNLIQDLLENWAIEQKITLPESLFVKNIENVQGDERDIIIFSIGYAADKSGKVALQFGSLNMQGGENRLNVAVTRAKEKVFVVSSILPQQLHTENTTYDGPKLLKKYLEYALMVSEGHYKPNPSSISHLPGQSLLKNKLLLLNEELLQELPFADLTVKNEKQYQSLILTDDDLFFQSLSAKDAHVYKPVMFSQKNWKFVRFYSRQYWKDRQKVGEKINRLKE